VDVIVTERGIAINPQRTRLIDATRTAPAHQDHPQLKDEAEAICGKPRAAEFAEKVVAAIKWVDGTVIDTVKQVKE
jgi:citrate lyase subunit alpha/citrate CoA-transferase